MARLILSIIFLFISIAFFAQPGKKPGAKEKAPTQKEMEEMMKDAQKAMDEMSPEDKKMMDSMGIKMPDTKQMKKNTSGISDKQLAVAWEDENQVVPKRSEARIASISQKVNDATMAGYLTAMQKKITEQLPADVKSTGDKVINYIKSNAKNSSEAGNMADAIWIAGTPTLALYVLGKVCADDPRNTDNLNNYAAMLSMHNAQHLAIPILNNLNKKFPGNSTLLNNLGQAWFGLGEISKAEKYLDSAIRIYAWHPQANITKAAIEESRGHIEKAVEAIKKSIKHAYTNEKEDMLRKHGYNITLKDLRVPFKPGSDPLGLAGFRRPEYPTSISELKSLKPIWESFNNDCDSKLAQLQAERKAIGDKYEKNLSSLKYGVALPIHYKKASLQLNEVLADYETKMKKLAELHLALAEDLQKIQQTHKRAAPEASCAAHLAAENDFIKQYNEKKKANDEQALEVFRHYFNDLAYWSQFTSIDNNQFDLIVLDFQTGWLRKLREYHPLLQSEFENLECAKDEDAQPGKLAEFDDIACEYKSKIDFGIVKTECNCSHCTTTFNLGKIKYIEKELGQDYIGGTIILKPKISADVSVGPVGAEIFAGGEINIELDQNKNVKDWNGTVSTGIETGVGISQGPLKAGVSITEAVEIEIGPKGVGDVTLVTKAEASVGVKVGPVGKTVEIGLESRVSFISGHGSIGGTGKWEGIKITEW